MMNTKKTLISQIEQLATQCVNGNTSNAINSIKQMKTSDAAFITLHVHAALLRNGAFEQASELALEGNWIYH